MHKLFTLILSLLFSSVMTQAFAQRNVYVWKNGCIDVLASSSMDSLTFSDGKGPFAISTSEARNISKNGFDILGTLKLNDNVKRLLKAYNAGVCYSAVNAEPTVDDNTVELPSTT